jgi:homoserine dehydrogenase
MKRRVNLGLIGLGTVGTGVMELLQRNDPIIKQKVGTEISVAAICDKDPDRLRLARQMKIGNSILTKDFRQILNNPKIDIVIELIGGYEPARRIVLAAIKRGKHVVTANKALLARNWAEIFSEAQKHRVLIYFEASVGAGIPVIQALNEGLSANKIKAILGILNGTTNYILTKMSKEELDFKSALAQAKKAGFAEADPSMDLEGIDTLHKLAILGSIAFGTQVNLEDVYCEGITHIDQEDMRYGRTEFGYVLKLLAILKATNKGIDVRVHPTFIPEEHLLTSVDEEYNAVYITGDAVGETMFYGKGAGQMPAASAVVSDIIYLSRNVYNNIAGRVPYVLCDPKKMLNLLDINEIETKYYIRFTVVDRPGVLSKISGVLGKNGVSIASVFQKESASSREVPIIMVTHRAKEGDIRKALREIDRLEVVKRKSRFIRIEEKA